MAHYDQAQIRYRVTAPESQARPAAGLSTEVSRAPLFFSFRAGFWHCPGWLLPRSDSNSTRCVTGPWTGRSIRRHPTCALSSHGEVGQTIRVGTRRWYGGTSISFAGAWSPSIFPGGGVHIWNCAINLKDIRRPAKNLRVPPRSLRVSAWILAGPS